MARAGGSCIIMGAICGVALFATTARAQSPEAFYAGKSVVLEVGYSAGSAYDVVARALARHWGEHIPGRPNVVVVDQAGAGSLTTANRLYNTMKRDGSEVATFGRSIYMEPLFGNKQALFDAGKISWIGSAGSETSVCVSWAGSRVKRWEDIFTGPFVMAANSPGSDTGIYATVLKTLFGAQIKTILGYPGGAEITHAIESGEVDGRCGWSWSAIKSSKPDWLRDKKINILAQLGLKPHPELPGVPLLIDLAKDERQRAALTLILRRQEAAWPFAAPPGVPADRLAALRAGFMATMSDPGFLEDAKKIGVEVTPMSGEELAAVVAQSYATPPAIVEDVRRLLNPS